MIDNVKVFTNLGYMLNNRTKLNMKKYMHNTDIYYTTKYSTLLKIRVVILQNYRVVNKEGLFTYNFNNNTLLKKGC